MLLYHSLDVYANLKARLQKPLPGIQAHKDMAPPDRFPKNYTKTFPDNARIASVLILLYPNENKNLKFPLMLRSNDGTVHGGQISLPGGKRDFSDSDNIDTALRETEEEIGVSVSRSNVLGSLSPIYIPPSNFFVYPFVAAIDEKPHFIPDAKEVAEIFEGDVFKLQQKTTLKRKFIDYKQKRISMPFYDLEGRMVWGATAMILKEFNMIWEEINF